MPVWARTTRHCRVTHHCDEQVRDAWPADIAHRRELATIDAVEQHHAAAKHLALMNRLERSRTIDMIGMQHHFDIARIELFHAALEHDAPVIDEHEVC